MTVTYIDSIFSRVRKLNTGWQEVGTHTSRKWGQNHTFIKGRVTLVGEKGWLLGEWSSPGNGLKEELSLWERSKGQKTWGKSAQNEENECRKLGQPSNSQRNVKGRGGKLR